MKKPLACIVLWLCFSIQSFEQQTDSVVLKNAVLYYYTYGKGEPIIILSGGPGVASHQEDDVAAVLGKNYSAVLFDQRGTGRSWTKPFDSSTINVNIAVADLDALRKHLHIDQLNLYGHSWGSILAAAYIARYPSNVRLFISVAGGEIDTSLTAMVNENIRARVQLSDTVKYQYWQNPAVMRQDSLKALYALRKLRVARSVYDTAQVEHVMQQVSHGERNTAMSVLMWKSLGHELHFTDRCKAFKGAVLIVFGYNDMIGLTTATQYLEAFPKAEFKGIYRSGHYPEIEQPGQFYKVVENFLQRKIYHQN